MPPLVTPTSQIVGVQAVLNVLFGRYKMVTNEVKDLAYGLYGKTPIPVNPDVRKKILKGYKRGETPVDGRAADYLEPELEKAREKIGDLAKDDFDLLIYALYPTTGEQFLKWKYGLQEKPREVEPKTLEDIRKEDEAIAAAIENMYATV
jgi:pyruvate/oxaloacetate carboxyltransferase